MTDSLSSASNNVESAVEDAGHVLIVEDEAKIAALLRDYFAKANFRSSVRDTGTGTVDWVREHAPDVIVLDLMLPGDDGLSICRALRADSNPRIANVPILMLTARVEEIDRLLGLELGADDYVCKPFSPREVVARVKAVLRRMALPVALQTGSLELDAERFEARVHGQALTLTPVEFRLLRKLAAQPGRVYSRQQLMDALYNDHRVVSDRTVDSHVKNLRRKLGDLGVDPIASIYGLGYRFEWKEDGAAE
jgi:two-component system response regulator BaeR